MELSTNREGYGCSSCAFFFLLSVKWNEIAQAVKYNVTFVIGLFITSIHPFFITTTLAQREASGANPSCLGVKAEQVASLLQGHMQKTTIHTGTHSDSQFRVPTVHVFGLLEKAVGPGAKPRGHRKNMNTSHRRPGDQTPDLCVFFEAIVLNTVTPCLHSLLMKQNIESAWRENKMHVKKSLMKRFPFIFVPGLVWGFRRQFVMR